MDEITRQNIEAALSVAGQGIYVVTESELRLLASLTDQKARQLLIAFIHDRHRK